MPIGAFEKTKHSFIIKILCKLEIVGNVLNLRKIISKKATGNTVFIGEQLKAFLPKSGR